MQKLSKAAIGRSYTIQWMFGVPEVMDFLREHHVEEMKLQTAFRCRK